MPWSNSSVTRGEWFPLSPVSSVFYGSNFSDGIDFRLTASETHPIRISNDTWRCPRAWTSQLSPPP